jgi:hypothetical protein
MCFVPKMKAPVAPRPLLPREAPKRVDEAVMAQRAGSTAALRRGLKSTYRTPAGGLQMPAMLAGKTLLGA